MQVSRFLPVIKVEHKVKTIYMLYEDFAVNLPLSLSSPIDVINSKTTPTIQFQPAKSGVEYNYEIFNCKGEITGKGVSKIKNRNPLDFEVPIGGFIRISQNNL